MENIITDILKIESDAQKRLADAEDKCIGIIADAKAEKEKVISLKIEEAKKRIAAINSDERKKAEKKIWEINNNKISEIERIDSIYEVKHSEWEENIFNQIING